MVKDEAWVMNGMGNPTQNVVVAKSFTFALETVSLYRRLTDQKEYILSRQLLRSGTSIGANVEEAQAAQTHADLITKMSIALKEARETHYWLRLLQQSQLVSIDVSGPLGLADELVRILTAIVKTAQTRA